VLIGDHVAIVVARVSPAGDGSARCLLATGLGNRQPMWLFWFVLPLAIVMVIGGLIAGGIFTIVFLPLALIIIATAVIFTLYGLSERRRTLPSDRSTAEGLRGGGGPSQVSPQPAGPGEVTDARRQAQ